MLQAIVAAIEAEGGIVIRKGLHARLDMTAQDDHYEITLQCTSDFSSDVLNGLVNTVQLVSKLGSTTSAATSSSSAHNTSSSNKKKKKKKTASRSMAAVETDDANLQSQEATAAAATSSQQQTRVSRSTRPTCWLSRTTADQPQSHSPLKTGEWTWSAA